MAALRIGVNDKRPPLSVKRAFPGVTYTRPFIPGVQTTPRTLVRAVDSACRPAWFAGLVPAYSFKLDPGQVLAGRWDPYIRELAAWHTTRPDAEVILWHEPENDPEQCGGVFPRYFNRIARVWRTQSTHTPLLYAAMAFQWLPKRNGKSIKGNTDRPADWQGVAADRFVLDAYSGQTVPLDRILPEHAGWQRWREYVVGDDEWGMGERGFITADAFQARAVAMAREADWLRTTEDGQRCRSYIYWNTAGTENNPAIVLDKHLGEGALRDLITVALA